MRASPGVEDAEIKLVERLGGEANCRLLSTNVDGEGLSPRKSRKESNGERRVTDGINPNEVVDSAYGNRSRNRPGRRGCFRSCELTWQAFEVIPTLAAVLAWASLTLGRKIVGLQQLPPANSVCGGNRQRFGGRLIGGLPRISIRSWGVSTMEWEAYLVVANYGTHFMPPWIA